MAPMRVDAMECARTIVLGCLERDFGASSKSGSKMGVRTILRLEPYPEGLRFDSPSAGPPQARNVEAPPAEPSVTPRSVATTIPYVLLCIAATLWLLALLAARA